MLTLEDSIRIKVPPKYVFRWFDHFAENYKSWHGEHVMAKWIKGNSFRKGSVLYAEEYLSGKLEKLSFKVIRYVPGELIEYKVLFPESIICYGGSFIVKPYNKGSIFTATLSFRFGYILSKLMPSRADALRKHMKEEGENLKNILEKRLRTYQ